MKNIVAKWLKAIQRSTPKTATTHANRRTSKPALMMQLEPRIMFDGAAVATAMDIAHSDVKPAEPVADHHLAPPPTHHIIDVVPAAAVAPMETAKPAAEIVFIEDNLPDYQVLIDALKPNSEVVILNSRENGLDQIAGYLQGRSDITSIHILSHAQDGQLSLGMLTLDQSTLQQNATTLANIGAALTDSGDIVLYGCDLAKSQDGMSFITQLSTLTSADVSASSDRTGSTGRGGDWVLEQSVGHVDADGIFVAEKLAAYDQLLPLPAATQQLGDTYWANNTGGNTIDGFTLVESTGATRQSSANSIYYSTAVVKDDPGVSGKYYAELTWTADNVDLGKFDLDGFRIQTFGNNFRLDFSAISGGSPVSETFTFNGAQGPLIVDLNAALFNDINSFTVRITNLSGAANVSNMDLQQVIIADLKSPNSAPAIGSLNADTVAWSGVGNTVTLDNGGNASLTDTELGALNGGNGDWSGASLTVQRPGTAISADTFALNTSGALFSVSGNNLLSGGQTFATFTNTGGVLTINFNSAMSPATTALVNDVARHISYRNDTPSGDATIRFTLSDGAASSTADVSVTSDSIYVTNTTDTATINIANGVSFSEAVAIAAADVTGSQTIIFDGSLAGQTVSTSSASSLGESLTVNLDSATGVTLTGGTLSIGSGFGLTVTNGTSDTASMATNLSGAGSFIKAGVGSVILSGTNSYAGTTAVSAGSLSVASDSNLGSGSITFSSGATLAVTGTTTIDNAINLNANGAIYNALALTLSGTISGSSTLTKSGAGKLTLEADNSANSWAMYVTDGTLSIGDEYNLGSGTLSLSNSTLLLEGGMNHMVNNDINLAGAGTIDGDGALLGTISGVGSLTKAGTGYLVISGHNTYTGSTVIVGGVVQIDYGDSLGTTAAGTTVNNGATLTISRGQVTLDEAFTLSGTGYFGQGAIYTDGESTFTGAITLAADTSITVRDTETSTISGVISGGFNLTKADIGTLVLSGSNTYTGSTTVSAGKLTVQNGDAIGNTSAVSVGSGAFLVLSTGETIGSLAGAGTVSLGANTLTTGGNNTSTSSTGVITGTGNLVKEGTGTWTVGGTNTYAGTTTVSSGALTITSDSNLGSGAVTLANGATLSVGGATTIDNAIALSGHATINNSANVTLSGVISGAYTLSKAGASTLTLSGANTYAATNLSAGTLSVASDANLGSDAVTLATGSALAITGATNIDNGIVLSGNATISNSANITLSGVISGANTLTKGGASALTLSGTNTYANTTVSAGTLRVTNDSNLGSGGISLAGGTTLAVTGVTTIDNAITLAGNATISTSANATLSGVIGGSSNLNKAGASTLTLSGTNTYGGTTTVSVGTLSVAADSNLGNGGLTLAAGSTLAVTGATTIDNALILSGPATVNTTADATLSGNIGGIGSLTKTGANTLTLSGTNSYAGTTTVSTGTLSVASDGNLGDDAITLAAGSTLVVTGATTIDNAITLSGNATVQVSNAVTLDGVISGAGGLTKTGAGTLTLANTNSFTGNVAVSAGGLTLSNGAAIDNSSAVNLSSGTTLTLTSSEAIGSLAGSGTVTLGANTLGVGGNGSSTSFAGVIAGSGGLTKTGAGTFTLSGTNTYTGNTTISVGSINAQNGAAIADTGAVNIAASAFLVLSAAETIGSLAGSGGVTLGANTLTTGGNNTSTTFSGVFSGSGDLIKVGSGTQVLAGTGSVGSMSGGMTLSGGVLSISTDSQLSSGTITLNGGTLRATALTTVDNAIVLAADSTINTQSYLALDGVVSGSGNLTKTGTSTLVLNAANTYTGTTYITTGYTHIKNSDSLGTSAGGTTVSSGAVLYFNGSANITDAITLGGTGINPFGAIYVQTGTSTISGAVTLTANTTMNVDGSSSLTFAGGITDGAGSYSLTKGGSGTLGLTGAGNYDGTTAINNGTLTLASDSNIGAGALTLGSGATLAIAGATTIDNAIVLSGGTATVTNSANATLSGNITGSGGFIKAGASVLNLSGTDSYTGVTNVSAGSLLVNGALSGTSSTTVESGATLGGNGSISNNVTVISGGTLSPGNSAGSITINGDLTMASGSTLAVEINGATAGTGYDQVIVNGAVDVSGATLAVTHGYTPGSGDTYNIIVNDLADAVTGSFSGISEGATLTAGGNSTVLTTSFIGGTGNDITLAAPINPTVISVTATDPDGTYKIGDTITIGVTFSEPVYLSTGTLQLTLETGTVDRAINYVSGSGSSTLYFNYTVQAGDESLDLDYASVSAFVANNDSVQSAGFVTANLNLPVPAAAGSLAANNAIVIDGVRPTASIVVADAALRIGETSFVSITFNEAVSGLGNLDFTVSNGTLSSLATNDGGITWTAILTPTINITDTTNLITLNNSGVMDAAGNTGIGTTDSNNYAIDNVPPTASIVVANSTLGIGENSMVTITFNEAVTGFALNDLTAANGILSNLNSADGGITWTATLTPTVNIEDTTNVITLSNTGVQDTSGNTGTGTTDSNNYAVDNIRPTATIMVADTSLKAGETSLVTLTFSEAVANFDNNDLAIANGTLSIMTTTDGGITWTGILTPTVNITDTTNVITFDSTAVVDGGGNTGIGLINSNNYAIDTARPTASIVVADPTLAIGETSLVTITFTEAVTGFNNADLTIANGTLTAVTSTDGGITWTATFTPTSGISDTTNLITLDNTGVQNAAGNAGSGITDSSNYTIDSVRPTASILIADNNLTAGETSLVTITFSEAVIGFNNADLTIAGGTLSTVTSSDGGITWTANFTPTANIATTTNVITLANTGLQDLAGNTGTGTTTSNNYQINTVLPTVDNLVIPGSVVYTIQPLITSAVDAPNPAQTFIPSIVLSPAANQIGGATNNTPLTTVEPPSLATVITLATGNPISTTLDTSALDTDPIGITTATSSGTVSSLIAPPNEFTLPASGGTLDVQPGVPLFIALPYTLDANTNLQTIDVRMQDGKPLPGWLRFDVATGTLLGQPPKNFEGKVHVQVTVRDSKGNVSSSIIELNVHERNINRDPVKPGKELKKPDVQIMGKPGLNEQFALYGPAVHHHETDALLSALSQLSLAPVATAQKA